MVDDHEMIRRGVRDLIADVPDIEFAGDAASGTTALEGIARADPDVAIIDLRRPVPNSSRRAGRQAPRR
jgi:DNA-binding NarL/FixJ family response regulator